MTRSLMARLAGPFIVLLGALATLPSMLGAEYDVRQNIGQGWTIAVIAIALVSGLLVVAWPTSRWARRLVFGLGLFLVLYGVVVGLWSSLIATSRPVPTEDLPYLIGLPVISGIGGLILLATTRRVPGGAGGPRQPIG